MVLYPLFGFITISYFDIKPYYVSSIIVLLVAINFIANHKQIRVPIYIKAQFVYLVFVFVSFYIANKKDLQFDTNLAQLLFILNAILVFIIIENSRFSHFFITTLKKLLYVFVLIAGVVSIIQYFEPTFFLYDEKYIGALGEGFSSDRRIISIFSWGDLMNTQYMAIGFAAIYGVVLDANKNNLLKSAFLILAAGIVAFLSGFRVNMVTYLLTTLLILRRFSYKSAIILILAVISFNVAIDFLNFNVGVFIEERIMSDTATSRIDAFYAFFHAFPENPFFGTGGERTEALFEGFGRVARMHNWHLNIVYYYGIFAFLAHSVFLFYLIKKTYRTAKDAKYWPPFVAMICYLVATMTDPRGEFFIPGILIMMVFNKYYMDKYNTQILEKLQLLAESS